MIKAHAVEDTGTPNVCAGLEATLDLIAFYWLVIHILISLTTLIAAMVSLFASGRGGIALIVYFLISTAIYWSIVLVIWGAVKALAEMIRLQKKAVGLEYSGTISGMVIERYALRCSNCGQLLHSETRCDHCNAEIMPHDSKSNETAL